MKKIAEDKLQRDQFVERIIKVMNTVPEGNFVATLNGQFGSGKSTLFAYLEDEIKDTFHVIKYDCWENSFFENPLIPLLNSFNEIKTSKDKVKAAAKKIIKNIPRILVNTLANAKDIDLSIDNSSIFDEFNSYKNAIKDYRNLLESIAQKKKIVLLVDELDRCLPEYQIKVLETIHHIFDIDNLMILIAIDKLQLEKSINTIYGEASNTYGYLSKFIDFEFELPNSTEDYVKTCFDKSIDVNHRKFFITVYKSLKLSLREQLKITKEYSLIIKSACDDAKIPYNISVFTFAVLLLKRLNNEIYKEFFGEKQNDYYGNRKINYNDTKTYKFIERIKNSNCKGIYECLLSDPNQETHRYNIFLFIGYLDDFHSVSRDDLAKQFNVNAERINETGFNFSYRTKQLFNRIIELIEIFVL